MSVEQLAIQALGLFLGDVPRTVAVGLEYVVEGEGELVQSLLGQVIRRPAFHVVHSDIFFARTGDDDERGCLGDAVAGSRASVASRREACGPHRSGRGSIAVDGAFSNSRRVRALRTARG